MIPRRSHRCTRGARRVVSTYLVDDSVGQKAGTRLEVAFDCLIAVYAVANDLAVLNSDRDEQTADGVVR